MAGPYFKQDRFEFSYDDAPATALSGGVFTPAAAATGLITCVSNANMADTDFITIGDGMNPAVVYEYDKAGDGVTGGRATWAVAGGAGGAADVAATLRTAILANQPGLSVTDNLDGTLSIAHKWPGTGGNVTITENVANAGFLVSGLSGGAAASMTAITANVVAHAATTTRKLMTAQRKMRIDKVEYINPTGLAGHSSNYWEIALKKGSTVMAQWSTDSDVAGQGTLTANAVVNLVLSGTDANLVADVADVLSLVLTKVSSAANLPAGRIIVHGRYVS